MKTSEKLKVLQNTHEDYEWYPTTDEILKAMNDDLYKLFVEENLARYNRDRRNPFFDSHSTYNRETDKHDYTYTINTFLDVGSGDGRVFDAIIGEKNDISIHKKYGIEIAQSQADDLIERDIFVIGRDFFKTSLLDKHYSVIFSNPPYSLFVSWVIKLLDEANFGVMYLVLPVRWKQSLGDHAALSLYEIQMLGEFDFTHAERTARARVNLIRLTRKRAKVDDYYNGEHYGSHIEYGKDDDPDSFERWIDAHFGKFKQEDESELEDAKEVKLKHGTVQDLIENYDYDMASLLEAFKALGKLPYRVIDALGMNRKSILEIIRENIKSLKSRYWRLAFERVSEIKSRLTYKTRNEMFYKIEEFNTLDFNEDNLHSIITWVIKHFNEYANEQILEVFDDLTSPDYIKAYKSNTHWTKDNWRYTGKGKPEKYQLDYRLVTRCYKRYRYDNCVVEDFIVICRNLGYFMHKNDCLDGEAFGDEQCFYTVEGKLAFSARVYKNRNLHLKVNQELMMKFNIEVARLRHWINNHVDIQNEFDVSEAEAIKLWKNPSLIRIGREDIPLLEYAQKTA
jgi:hypothetical protein